MNLVDMDASITCSPPYPELAIGVFKTAALALIGDISRSTAQHTSMMNMAEGFFGVGSIVGPAIVARLVGVSVSWKAVR